MHLLRRILRLSIWALALIGPASVGLCAAAVGSNHPASGAYSPVSPSDWGAARWPLGSSYTAGYGSILDVGVYSANATNVVLEIYLADTGADAAYDYTMTKGADNIWRAAVANVPGLALYAFRSWGPNWPFSSAWVRGNSVAGFLTDCDSLGNRFNPNKVLYDPYARELSHNVVTPALLAAGEGYGMYLSGGGTGLTYAGPITGGVAVDQRQVDTGHWAPKGVAFVDATDTGPRPNLNPKDAIIYETHLKGLTAHPSSVRLTTLLSRYSGFQDAANVPDSLRGTYAGAAYMAGYLRDLGFNTVEFLPVQDTSNSTNSTTAPTPAAGPGYWCYWTYGFFAPDRRYASNPALGGPTAEFKRMVAAFHRTGIEVYLDVVYNHTGEGGLQDNNNPNVAEIDGFRGLDNASYYTLSPGAPSYYWVSTGVGENFNCGSPPVQNLVRDSLAYWSGTMGVDGFRFDLAVELGRNGSSGFTTNGAISSPLLAGIASWAGANGVKIIAEPWDTNDGNEIGNFPAGWAEWNGNYRDAVRLAMTGNLSGMNGVGYADAFYGDYNQFDRAGGPHKSVNMLVCHDGFGMTDLVSYAAQANASLAWPFGPSDGGSNDNESSTWGGNQAVRRQVVRSLWAFQVLSRGLPMMVWGDEFGRTANGNNNAYDVDSVATWNNYTMIDTNSPDTVATGDATGGTMAYANNLGTFAGATNGNFPFLQYLLQLRAAHAAFRQQDYKEPVTFTNADGTSGFNEWSNPSATIYISGSAVGDQDFVVMSNFSGSSVTYTVPASPAGTRWVRLIDTNNWAEASSNCWGASSGAMISGTYGVGNRSVVVLEAVPDAR
jgi:glycogen operon protein